MRNVGGRVVETLAVARSSLNEALQARAGRGSADRCATSSSFRRRPCSRRARLGLTGQHHSAALDKALCNAHRADRNRWPPVGSNTRPVPSSPRGSSNPDAGMAAQVPIAIVRLTAEKRRRRARIAAAPRTQARTSASCPAIQLLPFLLDFVVAPGGVVASGSAVFTGSGSVSVVSGSRVIGGSSGLGRRFAAPSHFDSRAIAARVYDLLNVSHEAATLDSVDHDDVMRLVGILSVGARRRWESGDRDEQTRDAGQSGHEESVSESWGSDTCCRGGFRLHPWPAGRERVTSRPFATTGTRSSVPGPNRTCQPRCARRSERE